MGNSSNGTEDEDSAGDMHTGKSLKMAEDYTLNARDGETLLEAEFLFLFFFP